MKSQLVSVLLLLCYGAQAIASEEPNERKRERGEESCSESDSSSEQKQPKRETDGKVLTWDLCEDFEYQDALCLSDGERYWLSEFESQDEDSGADSDEPDEREVRLLQPNPDNTSAPYEFCSGTRVLDLATEPDPVTTSLLERLNFVFHKLDIARLAKSNPDVQVHILLGLMARHFFSLTWRLRLVEPDMPGRANGEYRYFLMMDKTNGDIIAAAFTQESDASSWRIHSLCVEEYYQNSGLGSVLLNLVARQLETENNAKEITLESYADAVNFYESHGFRKQDPHDPQNFEMTLQLDNWSLRGQFNDRQGELVSRTFIRCVTGGAIDTAAALLPLFTQIDERANKEVICETFKRLSESVKRAVEQKVDMNKLAHAVVVNVNAPVEARAIEKRLAELNNLIPSRIDPGYIDCSFHGRPTLSFSEQDRNEISGSSLAQELARLQWRLSAIERDARSIDDMKDTIAPEAADHLRCLKCQICSLREALRKHLPIIEAQPGTVFIYKRVGGSTRIYKKLSNTHFVELRTELHM